MNQKNFANRALQISFYNTLRTDINIDKCWTEETFQRNGFIVYWTYKSNTRKEG